MKLPKMNVMVTSLTIEFFATSSVNTLEGIDVSLYINNVEIESTLELVEVLSGTFSYLTIINLNRSLPLDSNISAHVEFMFSDYLTEILRDFRFNIIAKAITVDYSLLDILEENL